MTLLVVLLISLLVGSCLLAAVEIVGEAVAGESVKLRKELEKRIKQIDVTMFDVAEMLHKVKKGGYYRGWGFNTFTEYTDSTGLKQQRARYLARIAEVMEAVGIERGKYEPVGLKKLREITSLDPEGSWVNPETKAETPLKEFITGFIDKADEMSFDDMKQHVRTLKGLIGENDLVFETFCYTRSVKDTVIEPAKELARRNIGTVGKDEDGMAKDASGGACIEVWAVEYLNNPANNEGEQ